VHGAALFVRAGDKHSLDATSSFALGETTKKLGVHVAQAHRSGAQKIGNKRLILVIAVENYKSRCLEAVSDERRMKRKNLTAAYKISARLALQPCPVT